MTVDKINEIAEKICNENYEIAKEEALELYEGDFEALGKAADKIRMHFTKKGGSICSIINAKKGGCSENCRYCAQSAFWKTSCEIQPLIESEKAIEICKKALENNVSRISFVTAGKGLKGKDLESLLKVISDVKNETEDKMRLCASFGIIGSEEMKKLKESGVVRYHHNLETSRNYYPNICTTHSYDDRVNTIKAARNAGLSSCSGGIIGMGESRLDRIEMAMELRDLGVESIPVNVLSAVKGTPFENLLPIGEEEILRTIAVFRFILKDRIIRFAAGRKQLENNGRKAFCFGANGMITGDFLTLQGSDCRQDFKMFEELGYSTDV